MKRRFGFQSKNSGALISNTFTYDVDLNFLTNEEYDYLGYIIYEAETIPMVSEQLI